MAGFNFGAIGSIIADVMDTDRIDIARGSPKTNTDGTTGETDPGTPIYTDIPCHLSFETIDNPDPVSIDTKPVIVAVTIHCGIGVDLKNNDYITARKLAHDGRVIQSFRGVIGEPAVDQSRQRAAMSVRSHA